MYIENPQESVKTLMALINATEYGMSLRETIAKINMKVEDMNTKLDNAAMSAFQIGGQSVILDWAIRFMAGVTSLFVGTYRVETSMSNNIILIILGALRKSRGSFMLIFTGYFVGESINVLRHCGRDLQNWYLAYIEHAFHQRIMPYNATSKSMRFEMLEPQYISEASENKDCHTC